MPYTPFPSPHDRRTSVTGIVGAWCPCTTLDLVPYNPYPPLPPPLHDRRTSVTGIVGAWWSLHHPRPCALYGYTPYPPLPPLPASPQDECNRHCGGLVVGVKVPRPANPAMSAQLINSGNYGKASGLCVCLGGGGGLLCS